jgi:hypothetical protein
MNEFLETNMPSSPNYKRDYKQEYKEQGASKKAKQQRARNNKANRKAKAEGKIKKGDGKDVAHTKPSAKGSTFIQAASKNRSIPRTKTARRKKS